MEFFKSLFGPVMALFVVEEGTKAAIEPPAMGGSNDMYGGGDAKSMWGESPKWESRVDDGPSGGLGM
jgi:hypothetical protein